MTADPVIIDFQTRKPIEAPASTVVYFIKRRRSGGGIKIGTAKDPWVRLNDLQIGSDVRLDLIATEPGSYKRERELHAQFQDLHIRGEWFRPGEALRNYIKGLPDRYEFGRAIKPRKRLFTTPE